MQVVPSVTAVIIPYVGFGVERGSLGDEEGEGEEEGGATDRECDVRRLTVRLSDAQVVVPTQKTSDDWQIADDADNETSSNEMRSLELTPEILQGLEVMRGQRVVRVSMDPRGEAPQLQVYPRRVARAIETAWQHGKSTLELGSLFFDAVVHFDEQPIQRTRRGRRDICRAPVVGNSITVLAISNQYGWKFTRVGGQEVVIQGGPHFSPQDVIDLARMPEEGEWADANSASMRERLPMEPVPESTGALWEWCKTTRVRPATSVELSSDGWGVYTKVQNADIEAAFQEGKTNVEITIGVRTFLITFQAPVECGMFAYQEDLNLHRRRLVRRRILLGDDCEQALTPPAPVHTRDEDSFAICTEQFCGTSALPTLELPGCQHVLHTACLLPLAMNKATCPFCHADEDWPSIFPGR
mmetsp:Transcript_87635/g.228675  ORF Transcript_87635/g.228675 Transcript_87635/m.228675 type:complete len:412 (+) Transcript_87635:136-1371(+)